MNAPLARTYVCDRKDVPVDTQRAVFSSSLINDGLNKQSGLRGSLCVRVPLILPRQEEI